MQETIFIINNRFAVNSDRNEVLDKETGVKSRLEPRLMKLLCILAAQPGKVVKRELIIKEIWDDYPGANEGLNQAISFLRKLLADDSKEMIQTQPKSGYIFYAIISQDEASGIEKRKYIPAIVIAAALLLLLFFMVDKYLRRSTSESNAAEMGRIDSHQDEKAKFVKDTMGAAAKGDSIHGAMDSLRR